MANLGDSIRLTTVADLQALSELVNEYKKLGLSISGVAGASRIVSEQIKRDALEQANATKQSTLQTQLSTAEIKKQSAALDLAKKSSEGFTTSLTSLTGLRSQLIGLFGAMSIGAFAKEMIDAQSQVEAFELSMANLLGQKYGDKLVADLKKFTLETPLNFEQVIKSTNQLVGAFKAAGASSETIGREVPIILESLGNSAAALGGGDRLGRLTYAFSQVQATGRLMGTEVRQITETGFPLLAVMSERTGKSVQELQADIKNGQVGFSQFKDAILSAGLQGGVFAGAMDIMANTVRGRLDKLSETFFFASARIGDALSGSAKSAIDFANALIKTLFGTDEAVQRTIAYTKAIGSLILTYTLLNNAQRISAATTAAMAVAEKAWLVIKGEFILLTQGQAAANLLLTETQLEAAIAADTFNRAMLKNPIGLITIAIGTAIAAYQLYNATAEESKELTLENIKANDADIKNLLSKEARINAVASSLKGLTFGSEGYKHQIDTLIKLAPEYFSQLDREKSTYNEVALAVSRANTAIERKIKLMAMEKLAEKVADRSADIKLQIAQEEILDATRKKNAEDYNKAIEKTSSNVRGFIQQESVIYEGESKKLKDLRVKDSENTLLLQKVSNGLALEEQKQYTTRHAEIIQRQKNGEYKTRKDFTEALKKLDEEYSLGVDKTLEDNIKNGGKKTRESNEKALKYQEDTNKQKLILDETNALKAEQQTRKNQKQILDLEKEYAELRVVNAKGSQTKKVKALEDIDRKYREDFANLTRVWDKKDLEASEKFWKEVEKAEKESQDNRVKFSKGIDKVLEDAKETSEKNKTKIAEKYAKDLQKVDEDNLKESSKLLDKKYNLMDSLRLLDKISHAKTAKEITEIQKEENLKVLADIKDSLNQQLVFAKLRLERLKQEKGIEPLEYKSHFNTVLVLEQQYVDASSNLADEQSEQLKKKLKKREEIIKEALNVIYEAGKNVLSDIFSIKQEKLSQELRNAETELDKFRIRQQQKDLETEQKTIGFFTSLASGNWVQAIGNLVSVIDDLSTNVALERQAALLEDQLNSLKEIMGIIDSSLNSIGSSFESISEVYGSIFDVSKLQEFSVLAETSIEDRIQAEIKHGEQITANYNKAVKEEDDRYNKQVSNIEKAYDLEVKNINAKYDLIDLKANQAYNKETLAIVAAGSAQLEALITNEASLASVRGEFAAKRLAVEQAFPLASKAITEGMSQSEIDAINASIKARDEQFAKIQAWYNEELTFIANSEGQKRKEYTDTEKIQKQIRDNLDLAAIKFQADEIKREKDKADAILIAEKNKNTLIQTETLSHNQILVNLELQKNADILNSFTTLKILLQAQINQITGALVDSANISAEAFAKLKQQLEEITILYKALSNGTTPPTIVIPTIDIPRIGGFEKGTDNTSVSLSGATVDNRGGKLAILHPNEAVFSKADMTQMTRFLGKRPTRDEVIDRFKMGTKLIDSNSFIQKISPYVISKTEVKNNTDVRELTKKIERLTKEVVKRQQPMVTVDKNGIRTFVTNINSQIEIKNQKFSS